MAEHPILQTVEPTSIRPTQVTVGRAEVADKRAAWEALGRHARKKALESHVFPGVYGPKKAVYIIDHHHFGLAMLEEGCATVPVMISHDFSALPAQTFWRAMEFYHWAHPYDERGRRVAYEDIPRSLAQLRDDPYRSLAAYVRYAGGCAKNSLPYAEFLWADFFREHFELDGSRPDKRTVKRAIALAQSAKAAYLPGWSGSSD